MASPLKAHVPAQLPTLPRDLGSDELHVCFIPSKPDFRRSCLEAVGRDESKLPPPLISCSDFVPRRLVELLMRKKKDSALGVKFLHTKKGDQITDMEGAMHTFVTPIVPRCEMVGDYRYDPQLGGHGVNMFGEQTLRGLDGHDKGKCRVTRSVVMSGSIQMDFENSKVMLRVCKLGDHTVVGQNLLTDKAWEILDSKPKQDDTQRYEYDEELRRHMIYHLTKEKKLPRRRDIEHALDDEKTIKFLETLIMTPGNTTEKVVGVFSKLHNDQIVSLELLFNTALHQVRNEFAALEALCPRGHVYTYDPASIFAREIGPEILNRLMLAALRHLSDNHKFENMRVFAFNDYADRGALNLVRSALKNQKRVQVVSKQELFRGPGGPGGLYDVTDIQGAEGAMLVIHNNSDGFGQNIETERMYGSLDGAIGSCSSAAASLRRDRKDLLDFIW
ncbi:uncharacterized protein LY89DRAFT_780236 [Mollisia scopiformis]|uniref:Uncharacterized protein n=1 Tax=Mollisia scopiformis TaxID=149040 RepID=A0A194XHJ4_MOLSC|nr:uncharacterized protein LY89DRAFT_780236 [Mollisia scopiformis]KUJ19247.1 hypothetical protein LY89DRAFT_780236 [Mollisia scopiformis]